MATIGIATLETQVDLEGIQGGIRDAEKQARSGFGKIGGVMKSALSTGAAAAASALTALSGAMAFAISEASAAQDAQAQLNAVLESTGGVAGVTAEMANELAAGFQSVTRFSDEAVLGAESVLLTFTKIGSDVFPDALATVLDMSQALGQDLKSSAIQLGKALQDPVAGVSALREVGVNFSQEQGEVIKNLVETGQAAEAQMLILRELQTEFGGSAQAAGETFAGQLTILQNSFRDVAGEIGGELLPILTALIQDTGPVLIETFQTLSESALPEAAEQAAGFFRIMAEGVSTLSLLLTWSSRIQAAFEEQSDVVLATSTSYEAYVREILRAQAASSILVTEGIAESRAELILLGDVSERTANLWGVYSEAQFNAVQSGLALQDVDMALANTYSGELGQATVRMSELWGDLSDNEWEVEAAATAVAIANENLASETEAARLEAEKFRDRNLLLMETQENLLESLRESAAGFEDFADTIDRDLDSPITAFIEDLQFMMVGGFEFVTTAREIMDSIAQAVQDGRITPEEGVAFSGEILAGMLKVKAEAGLIDWDDATQGLADALQIPRGEAENLLNDFQGLGNVLQRVNDQADIGLRIQNVDDLLAAAEAASALESGLSGIAQQGNAATSAIKKLARAVNDVDPTQLDAFIARSPAPLAAGLEQISMVLPRVSSGFDGLAVTISSGVLASIDGAMEAGDGLVERLESILSTAQSFGRVGGFFADMLDEESLGPMRAELESIDERLEGIRNGEIPVGDMFEMMALTARRAELAKQIAEQEQRILEFQQRQRDLQLLQAQLDLLKLVEDAGLDRSILEGLVTGLDANASDLLAVMNAVMEALIQQAEETLETGSPSRRFERIAESITDALENEFRDGGVRVQSAMATMMENVAGIGESVSIADSTRAVSAAQGTGAQTKIVLDMSGALITNRAEFERWVDAAFLRRGRIADVIRRTA